MAEEGDVDRATDPEIVRPSAAPAYADPVLARCDVVEVDGVVMRRVGPVAVRRRLGAGGMGVVFAGTHLRLGAEVAVKVLAGQHGSVRSKVAERFKREARYAAGLRSPNLVGVLDVDDDAESRMPFIVMEFVKGLSAEDWRAQRPGRVATETDALDVCIAATSGLAAAHAEGIVHRDVKPSNVLLHERRDGSFDLANAKLADLGLAFAEGAPVDVAPSGILLGSPGYMPPEQIEDPRRARKPADVFAMGATLYALLVGRPPFHAASNGERLVRTLTGEYDRADVMRPGLSPAVAALVERCLLRAPDDRFADASSLVEAMRYARGRVAAPRTDDDSSDIPVIQELADVSEVGLPAVTPSLWTIDAASPAVATPSPARVDAPEAIPTITVLLEGRRPRAAPRAAPAKIVRQSAPAAVAPAPPPKARSAAPWIVAATIVALLVGGLVAYLTG